MVPPRAGGRLHRPFALILLALGALVLAGCGVQAGADGPSASTTSTTVADAPTDQAPADQATIERMRQVYADLGFTEEEADCMAEAMSDLLEQGATIQPDDTTVLMDVLNGCDISMSRMMEVGEGIEGGGAGG